jgi:hypothetical protein
MRLQQGWFYFSPSTPIITHVTIHGAPDLDQIVFSYWPLGYSENEIDMIRMEWLDMGTTPLRPCRLFSRLYTRYDTLVRLGRADTMSFLVGG